MSTSNFVFGVPYVNQHMSICFSVFVHTLFEYIYIYIYATPPGGTIYIYIYIYMYYCSLLFFWDIYIYINIITHVYVYIYIYILLFVFLVWGGGRGAFFSNSPLASSPCTQVWGSLAQRAGDHGSDAAA